MKERKDLDSRGNAPCKLDLNERSDGAPDWIARELADIPREYFWRYIERDPLEQKLATLFGLSEDMVLATNGGDEGILYLISALQPGAPLYLPLPTFGLYQEQAEFQPVETLTIPPLPDFRLDIEALCAAIRERSGGMAVVVRPNNPTGELVPKSTMLELLAVCRVSGTTLLVDEAYAEFAEDDLADLLMQHQHLVILRTFSKAYGLAGLRIGYLMGGPVVPLKKRALPFNVASLSLYFADKALEHQAAMSAYAGKVALNRERIARRLHDLGVDVFPGRANFLFLKMEEMRARFLAGALACLGISVRSFSRAGLQGCLRISIPGDANLLEAALENALNPDLICLDVDGCLIDVRESFDRVVYEIVLFFTGQKIQPREIVDLRAKGGYNDDNVLAHALIEKRGERVPLERVVSVFRDYYFGNEHRAGLAQTEKPFAKPGLFDRLEQRAGLALVTGRNREETALALPLLELEEERVMLVTIDDVARGKPDPEGILSAAQKLNARNVWMVGDNVDDILAARAAGAIPIGISQKNPKLLRDNGAAIVLENINQIEALL